MEIRTKNKTCLVCGAVFVARRYSDKFCSSTCKDRHNNAKKAYSRVCDYCGKTYTAKCRTSRFCSVSCGVRGVPVPVKQLTCIDCGAVFMFKGRTSAKRCQSCHKLRCLERSYALMIRRGRIASPGAGRGGNQWGESNPAWLPPELRKARYTGGYRARCFSCWPRACVVCGTAETATKLHVHHVDGNPSNNHPTNLVPVCRYHHKKLHRRNWKCTEDYKKVLFDMWPIGRSKIAELSGNPVAIKIGESEPKADNSVGQGQRIVSEINHHEAASTAQGTKVILSSADDKGAEVPDKEPGR